MTAEQAYKFGFKMGVVAGKARWCSIDDSCSGLEPNTMNATAKDFAIARMLDGHCEDGYNDGYNSVCHFAKIDKTRDESTISD
ncbi:MAG: hypothetical protein WA323_03090 [Candidatus Nitrosopolaris sp.]